MVNYSAAASRLDATFAALADPTRRAILMQLAARPEASVSEIAEPFRMSLPAVSKHLHVLERAGLLARRKEGRVHHLRLVRTPLESADAWIETHRRFWEERLDALDRYLKESKDEEESSWRLHPRRRSRRSASRARTPRRAKESFAPGPSRKR